jgi:hypothetical protein
MRYSKRALLIFGLGTILGFAGIVEPSEVVDRGAAVIMALGLVLLPVAVLFDLGHLARFGRVAGWLRPDRRGKRKSAQTRRPPRRGTSARRKR